MKLRVSTLLFLALIPATPGFGVGPTVVPTAEGQVGETPGPEDRVVGRRFESVRGLAGEILLGGLTIFGGAMPPPPEFGFVLDRIHGDPNPVPVLGIPATFGQVFDQAPTGSARSRNANDDGDFVAFSFASNGTLPGTMAIQVPLFDEQGMELATILLDNVPTFPDPLFNDTAVAVDDQGRATLLYVDFPSPDPPRVKATRYAADGNLIDPPFPVGPDGNAGAEVALLDPFGGQAITVSSRFPDLVGHIIDFTGEAPIVLPEFPINSTAAVFAHGFPAAAADPSTGISFVAWEDITGNAGNPIDVRGRRFDADGNPIGDDFIVNTTTDDAQGQVAVAADDNGNVVVAWAGDPLVPGNELDIFAQVYDAEGQPIDGEIQVNTTTAGIQDRPAVRFLPEPDAQGRPQFNVTWRDVTNVDGTGANGTGTSYKCFSIEGEQDPLIFEDGFESGDTTAWSDTQGG